MSKRLAQLTKPLVNRIVGHGEEAVDQLLANPLNYRLHPDNQQHALAGAIDDIGFIRSVTVNRRTGRVVDGHLRVTLAARSGVATLPVEYVDLSEAEEAQALLSLDPIAAMAISDREKLDELMRAVQSDDERVQAMLSEMAEANGLEHGKVEPPADPGAQVDKAEELREKWGVEPGQLWQLGEHRLICGDCTDPAVVARVMGGERAILMVTDPPYGVDYHGNFIQSGKILSDDERIWQGGIENDEGEFADTIESAFSLITDYLLPGAVCLVCAPPGRKLKDFMNLWPDDWHFQSALVWNKQSLIISRWDYHPQHEMILFGWKKGARHNWYGGTKQSTVWDIPRHQGSGYKHPTEKPLPLYERGIENHSKAGEVVVEPFSGSGTSICACERLGRKCRAVEISPAYVAVALERWATMTGQTPVLVN